MLKQVLLQNFTILLKNMIIKTIICIFLLNLYVVMSVKLGDVHTSAAQMLQLVESDVKLVESLKKYLVNEEQKLDIIRRYFFYFFFF